MKKKMVSLCLVIAMFAIAIVGGTLAYFTDTETQTNTFTVGDVDIAIAETFVQDSKMYPGVDVEKKVAVKVEEGSEDAWVWVTYTIPTKFYEMIDLTWSDSENWTEATAAVDGDNTVITCKYTQKMTAGDETDVNLTAVKLKPGVSVEKDGSLKLGENTWNGKLTIDVNAYAIQAAGLDSIDAAYDAYNK